MSAVPATDATAAAAPVDVPHAAAEARPGAAAVADAPAVPEAPAVQEAWEAPQALGASGRDPAGPWTVYSLGFAAPYRTAFFSYDEGELPAGQFRIRTRYTGLSAGTELTHFRGTNPYLLKTWDETLKLFRSCSSGAPGAPGAASQRYPLMFSGYMEVGEVTASRPSPVSATTTSRAPHQRASSAVSSPMTPLPKTITHRPSTPQPKWAAAAPYSSSSACRMALAPIGPICAT